MGKYSKFRGKVSDAPKPESWAKIDAHKSAYLAAGIDSFESVGESISVISEQKEAKEKEAKELGYKLSALERIFLDLLEASKLDSVSLESGQFSRQDRLGVVIEDKPAFYAYLKANGMEDLFTVNANTAGMIVKECLLGDKELPPGTDVNMSSFLRHPKTRGE